MPKVRKVKGRIFFYEETFGEGNRLGLRGSRITCSFTPPLAEEIKLGARLRVAKGFEIAYVGSLDLDTEISRDVFTAQYVREPVVVEE